MVDFCRSGHKFKKDDAREDILAEGFGVDDRVHFWYYGVASQCT